MILVDANLLIYAHIDSFSQHAAARKWLDAQLSGTDAVGMPWASLLAFLRVVTNARVLSNPEPIGRAWSQVQAWLACGNVWVPHPTERHADQLGRLIERGGISANLFSDAHLAALAMEHGLTLCSNDGDFARFPGLRWLNPLAP